MQHIEDNGQSLVEFIRTAPIEKLRELLNNADFPNLLAADPVEPRMKHSYVFSAPLYDSHEKEVFAVSYSAALSTGVLGKTEKMPLAA